MGTREMSAIAGVTLAVITTYLLTRDLINESLGLYAPQTDLTHVQVQAGALCRWCASRVQGNPHS